VTAHGREVFRAHLTLTDQSGGTKSALTNPFCYYHLGDFAAGETYVTTVQLISIKKQ
jgi:hypothetical protein